MIDLTPKVWHKNKIITNLMTFCRWLFAQMATWYLHSVYFPNAPPKVSTLFKILNRRELPYTSFNKKNISEILHQFSFIPISDLHARSLNYIRSQTNFQSGRFFSSSKHFSNRQFKILILISWEHLSIGKDPWTCICMNVTRKAHYTTAISSESLTAIYCEQI
jgi:hypothetical protein